MQNTPSILLYSVSVILFIGALTYGVQLFQGNSTLIDYTDDFIYEMDREIAPQSNVTIIPTVTGHQIRHLVYHMAELNADIEVEGNLYDKTMLHEHIDVSSIPGHVIFDVNVLRDSRGNIERIIFQQKG